MVTRRYRFFIHDDGSEKDFCIYKGKQGVTTGDWGTSEGWEISDPVKDMKKLDYQEISRLEALLLTGQDLEVFYENIIKRSQVT